MRSISRVCAFVKYNVATNFVARAEKHFRDLLPIHLAVPKIITKEKSKANSSFYDIINLQVLGVNANIYGQNIFI